MTETAELGDFLKARRAALDPADLGLPTGFNQRRVAGLRREELAQLAGISVDYYTRLEQGRARNVSDSVLESLSRALRLHRDEESYLRNLAAPKRKRMARPRVQRIRPELQSMMNAIHSPAFVFGRYGDVLAWNPLGAALTFDFAACPPRERNIPRLFFLDESAREMHPEWETVAKEVVANLRSESGKYPDDPYLAQLVGELSLASEEFRKLWAKHTVREKAHAWKVMINPIVGELKLRYETLRLPADPDQALVIYTAEPGSDSERALRLLASWVADPADA
ncbi:Helix-turn-helix domain-containing protein [Amycolatopsis lurida]|uniref:XRE family transcriptional regulator n=1 Tax=Amycolatopsis lurida NRRL 2430 TaxID=1460371 RepID=A0A2P2G112_AMYLU|nr:helix-turn-helix transcriptional regulator [Amycolatopsis lurida]KFU82654.1 XRE family transcriptional regulator [Amycolatopsis lurida NRRL 2430]SEE07100.1 Helix-turn-helix domain-containing protein [Amycolatopsis lurida]